MRKRKYILYLLLTSLLFFGGLFFASSAMLEMGSRKALDYLVARGPDYGFELTRPDFQSVEVISAGAATWYDFSAGLRLKNIPQLAADRAVTVVSRRIALKLESFRDRVFLLTAEGIDIAYANGQGRSSSKNAQPFRRRMQGGFLQMRFQLDFLRPGNITSQIRLILKNIEELLNKGKCTLPITFLGNMVLSVQDRPLTAIFRTVPEDGETIIIMDKNDIRIISQELDLEKPLTPAEVEVLSRHPLRAVRLLKIKKDASAISADEHEKNQAVPEDAYRHVLWSYLLTKEYGADFAKKVTDAHEEGLTGNTREERLMDVNNNKVGRNYAEAGYSVSSLLKFVMTDSEVILSPGQVARTKR